MIELADLTTEDVRVLASSGAVAVQPIGAIEQHGAHLPLRTDAFLAEQAARAALRHLDDPRMWLLPTLAYGTSAEHLGWPGTISMSTSTMAAVCMDLATSLVASGCEKLVFVNGHGGQTHLLDVVARDMRVATGLQVFTVMPLRLGAPDGAALDDEFAIHGGQDETSLMLHLAPELVRMDRAKRGGDATAEVFARLRTLTIEGGASPAWLTRDVSENGVIGDPTVATAELGQALHEHQVERLVTVLGEIGDFDFAHGPQARVATTTGAAK